MREFVLEIRQRIEIIRVYFFHWQRFHVFHFLFHGFGFSVFIRVGGMVHLGGKIGAGG